jgi:MSHA biogenesis protein MshL
MALALIEKMKKTIFLVIICLLAVSKVSCSKRGLEKMPITQTATKKMDNLMPMEEMPVAQMVKEVKEREKFYSLSATDMQLRNVLFILSRELPEYNIVVDPDVTGRVTVDFKDLPLEKVLAILLEPLNLEYTIEDNILRVSNPRMVTRTFRFVYVTSSRKSASTLLAVTGGEGGEGGAASSGSVESGETVDVWAEMEAGVSSLMSETGRLSINKRVGYISVTDYRSNLRGIEAFIKFFKSESGRQIYIRAKLLEVTLKEGFQFGIDWDASLKRVSGISSKSSPLVIDNNLAPALESSDTFFTPFANLTAMTLNRRDFSLIIRALTVQGKVSVLSSPQVTTMNGQTAIIRSVREDVVFQTETTTGTSGVPTQTVSADPFTFGVYLAVTPHADAEGMITMNIHPSVSSLVEIKSFPTDEPAASKPIIDTRETEVVVSVKNGEMIIIAGLMKDDINKSTSKIPLLGDIPYLGRAFQRTINKKEKTELVILLSPTIVGPQAKDFGKIRAKYKMLQKQFP